MADTSATDTSVPDFRELLKTTTSDNVERPRGLPKGSYFGMIMNHGFDRSRQKQTAFVRFNLKIDAPGPDVPAGACDGIDFSRRELRYDLYITPRSMYRLTDTLDAVLGRDSRVADERIPDMDGQRVLISVEPQLDNDGKDTGFNNVTGLVKAE